MCSGVPTESETKNDSAGEGQQRFIDYAMLFVLSRRPVTLNFIGYKLVHSASRTSATHLNGRSNILLSQRFSDIWKLQEDRTLYWTFSTPL